MRRRRECHGPLARTAESESSNLRRRKSGAALLLRTLRLLFGNRPGRVRRPARASAGCAVPVAVVINGIPSNTATIAVSPDGGACSDPLGIVLVRYPDRPSRTGPRASPIITLSHTDGGNPADTGDAVRSPRRPSSQYARRVSAARPLPVSCLLITGQWQRQLSVVARPPCSMPVRRSRSPDPVAEASSRSRANGAYGGRAPRHAGRNLSLSGTGDGDVGPFTASLSRAAPMTWTNRTALTSITPGTPFTVNWAAGDPASYVVIDGSVRPTPPPTSSASSSASSVRAPDTFTVPGYITAGCRPDRASSSLRRTEPCALQRARNRPGLLHVCGRVRRRPVCRCHGWRWRQRIASRGTPLRFELQND